jgi:hypothetical protein
MIASRRLARAVSAAIGCWMVAGCQLPDEPTDTVQKNATKHATSAFGSGGGGGGEGGHEGDGSTCDPPILTNCWHCQDGFTVIEICDDPPGGGTPGDGGGCHPCGCPGCGGKNGENPNVLPPRTDAGLTNFASAIGRKLPDGWHYKYANTFDYFGITRPSTRTVEATEASYSDSTNDLKATIVHENVHVQQCMTRNLAHTANSAAFFLNQLEATDAEIEYVRQNGMQDTPLAPRFQVRGLKDLWDLVIDEQTSMINHMRAAPGGETYYQIWKDPTKGPWWYELNSADRVSHCP